MLGVGQTATKSVAELTRPHPIRDSVGLYDLLGS
jgi:hypothetical protein